MKKRLASLQAGLLALVLLFSLLPVSSFATELDAAPDSVITTQEDAAADRNTAAEESGEHTPSASDAQPAAGGTESTASDSSAGTEQDETLTSAPSDTTSEAADTVEIPNTQDAAHEDDVNRMVAVQNTGFSAADFSFYEVRTWTGSHYERMRLEKPTQLVENDGKYTLYFPYGGAGTYKWNVRVEAPVNYSDTFSLYYMTFLTGDGITTDEGYSVNAYSSLHTKEDASVVQSVESDIHPHSTPAALGGNIYYSKTITLIWTENGEKKTCLIDVKPYCDMELSTNFNISEKNGSKPGPRPLEQIDSTTYKTNLVKGRESYAQIVLMDSTNRLQVSYGGSILADGVTNTGCIIPLDTAEAGTKEYKIELRDSRGEAEAKTYTLIAETLPYDYTPESDTKKTTQSSQIPARMYKVTNEDTATLKFGLTDQQIKAVENAGGQTSYLWTNNGQVLSTESTCKVPTEYNVDKAIFSVTVTNTVDGIAWSKSFSIPVKIAIKGNPPGIFYAKIKTDSTKLTFGHTASDLKAVVDNSAPTDLLYQWYSKNGNKLTKITDATAATYTPPTNAVGTVEYVLVPRRFRVLGSAVHGQPLRLGENDVVGKGGVYIRLDVLRVSPSCAAVLDILPKLPRVLPLDVDGKPDEQGGGNAHAQVDGVKAGKRGLKRGGESLHDVQRLLREVRAGSQPRRLPQLGGKERDKDIGEVGKQELLYVDLLHSSSPLSLLRDLSGVRDSTFALSARSCSSTEGLSCEARLTSFAVYSRNAAVSASASLPLKKTRYFGGDTLRSFFTAKSTPYFRATRSKDLMLLSVISMLDTP